MIYRRGIHTREKYLFPDNPYYVPMSTFLTCREYKYDKNFIINYLDVVEYKGIRGSRYTRVDQAKFLKGFLKFYLVHS